MNTTQAKPLTIWPVERKDGSYAVRICLNQGEMSLDLLQRLSGLMDQYAFTLRVTTAQRLNLAGVSKEQVEEIAEALGAVVRKCAPGVSVCTGAGVCRMGVQETGAISDTLVAVIQENGPYPFKIKSGVSGCKMSCGLSHVRDIGLVAGVKGWDLYFGGCATAHAAPGILLGKALTEEEAMRLVARGLVFYRENGKKRERIGGMVRRLGAEAVTAALL